MRAAARKWLLASGVLVGSACCMSGAVAAEPQFSVPRDRATWESMRASVRQTLLDVLGDLPTRPKEPKAERVGRETRDGYSIEMLRIDNGAGAKMPALLLLPAGADAEHRVPALLYLHSYGPRGKEEVLRPGPDGDPPGEVLAKRGFAVLAIDAYFAGERRGQGPGGPSERGPKTEELSLFKEFLIQGKSLWGMMVRDDLVSLDYLLSRPEIDPARVGATGISMGASRTWWLMALDERVACGVAVACMPRFHDLLDAHEPQAHSIYLWVPGLLRHFDTEAVFALCAPRPLATMVGDRDSASPVEGVKKLEATSKRMYALYDKRGNYQHTLFGGLDHRYTLLEWDMMLEFFDKHFLPQGPAPLGHDPEPEPSLETDFEEPAAHGIAGWVAEMSQRPGTWTWKDGVITCAPGKNEYGWLRAPVELEDFVLSVEWKVPKRGNTGVFLRARPVPWQIPPSEAGKTRVSTLGLTWPSRTGLEVQSTDDPGDANKYSSCSLYRHAAPAANPTKPAGEWNRYTVRLRGMRVEIWCNGQQVMDTHLDRYPTLRQPPLKGYFGLQNHGVGAEFRNVRYRRLQKAGGVTASAR
jgi:dienelactone hydrolase